jgi:hypothetical protein
MKRELVFPERVISTSDYSKFREVVVNLQAKDNRAFFIK